MPLNSKFLLVKIFHVIDERARSLTKICLIINAQIFYPRDLGPTKKLSNLKKNGLNEESSFRVSYIVINHFLSYLGKVQVLLSWPKSIPLHL